MRVCALTRQRYLDVKCYYSPYFSITLLSQVSVIKATGHPKQYISEGMQLIFAPKEEVLDQNLMSNFANLDNVDYNHDCSTCMLTYVYHHNFFAASLIQASFNQVFVLLSLLLFLLSIKMILKLLS